MVKGIPQLNDDLRAATHKEFGWGPKRRPGEWHLLYLAFVVSRIPDIQPWYLLNRLDASLWRLCGFGSWVPSYRTVHERFIRDIEPAHAAFEAAAATLIQQAQALDSKVGAWWHVDASEAQTHAAPQHDCRPGDNCPTQNYVPRLPRLDDATTRRVRQRLGEEPEDVNPVGFKHQDLVVADVVDVPAVTARGKRFTSGGHYWRSRDAEAGTRAYTKNGVLRKVWHGHLQMEMIDHYTGGLLASFLIPADTQESAAYPEAFNRAFTNCGQKNPLIVAGDRGYSFTSNFDFNTNRGVASAFPYRRRNQAEPKKRTGNNLFDPLGIPKCKGCGEAGRKVRFCVQGGRGRLWFTCRMPINAICRTTQTIFCDRDGRNLLPLWRTEAAYAAMRASHQTYEAKHRSLRIQYLVAPDALANRPKRVGRLWQQVRSAAAMLVDWLRILHLAGWSNGGSSPLAARPTTTGTRMHQRLGARYPSGAAPPPPPAPQGP